MFVGEKPPLHAPPQGLALGCGCLFSRCEIRPYSSPQKSPPGPFFFCELAITSDSRKETRMTITHLDALGIYRANGEDFYAANNDSAIVAPKGRASDDERS